MARTLGVTLADLRRRMSVREYRLWSALYDTDPWGPERMEWMLAQLTAVLATVHSAKGSSFQPGDFIPDYGGPQFVERSDDELRTLALKSNYLLGGKVT